MLTSVPPSLTQITLTLKRDCSFFGQVAQMEVLLLLLLSLQMSTHKLTRQLALLDLNGEDRLNSHHPLLVPHHLLKGQERTGRADCLTSTLPPSLQTLTKPGVNPSARDLDLDLDLLHHCDNLALSSKSSFASLTTTLLEVVLVVVRLLQATNTLNHPILLRSLSHLPLPLSSDESQTPTGVERHRQPQRLLRTT
jgi:hypothetical protein